MRSPPTRQVPAYDRSFGGSVFANVYCAGTFGWIFEPT